MSDRPESPMRLLLVLVTVTLSWAGNLTDREVLKQELFVQKLASKLFLSPRYFQYSKENNYIIYPNKLDMVAE